MKRRLNWPQLIACLIILIGMVGCSARGEGLWLDAPDWSRAYSISRATLSEPADIVADLAGNSYVITVEAQADGELQSVIVHALDSGGDLRWNASVSEVLVRPDNPRLILADSFIQIFWLDQRQLYTSRLTTDGQLLIAPTRIDSAEDVDYFDAAISDDDSIELWYSGNRRIPGVYRLTIDESIGVSRSVDGDGNRPILNRATDGTLHAIWIHYPPGANEADVYYARYAADGSDLNPPALIYEPFLTITSVLEGPIMATDKSHVYIAWSIAIRTGPSAGAINTHFVSFPIGQPDAISAEIDLSAARSTTDVYMPYASQGFATGERVDLQAEPIRLENRLTQLNAAGNGGEEVAIIASYPVLHEFRKDKGQVGVIYFSDGQITSSQLLSFTLSTSRDPALFTPDNETLYTTWLERDGEQFDVYYAGSGQHLVSSYSGVTGQDIGRIAANGAFGIVSGVILSPIFVGILMIPPLVMLGLTAPLRRYNRGDEVTWATIASIVLMLLSFWIVKVYVIPGLRDYVPFSAWIPRIPEYLDLPLIIGTQAVTFATAFGIAYRYTFQRRNPSLLWFIMIYSVVDGLITTALYGVVFFNAT